MSEHINQLSRRAFVGGAAILGAAACTTACNPMTAFAEPTAADKQAEAAATLDKLNAMQQQAGIAEADYFTALSAQEDAQNKMVEAQKRIDEASSQISELQDKLGTRARSMYRSGSLTFIDLLLGATTFQAFTNNWDLLNDMNDNDAEMVQQTKDLRAEVETQKAEYAEQEKIAAEQAEKAREVYDEAQSLVAEMQATYDSLSAEAAQLLEQERQAREAAAAQAAQEELEQQQAQQNNSNNGNSGGGASNGGSSNSGSGSSPSYNEPSYDVNTGNAIVDRAYSWVGRAEYVWGACSPGAFDCSGFVSYCLTGSYSRLGTTYTFLTWPRVYDPQPGDVCVNESHCGIYIGGGQMIHAATYGVGVIVGGVQSGMIYVRY